MILVNPFFFGGSVLGLGALIAGSASMSGTGVSSSTGTGALVDSSAQITGAGGNISIGTGALVAQAASMAGVGVSKSDGAGALASQSAVIAAAGTSKSTGTGAIIAAPAALAGAGMGGIFDAATFGTVAYGTRGAALTGSLNGKKGIYSGWHRLDGGNGVNLDLLTIAAGSNLFFLIGRSTANKFYVLGRNAAGTTILTLGSAAAYTSGVTWWHVLFSWDLATVGARHCLIQGVSDLDAPSLVFTNDTLKYTEANSGVGANAAGGFHSNVSMGPQYLNIAEYLDFSDINNVRKFISAGGKPGDLGIDGSLPTGTAPIVYQYLKDGEAPANFYLNRGTGGNYTSAAGSLTTASSSPSD